MPSCDVRNPESPSRRPLLSAAAVAVVGVLAVVGYGALNKPSLPPHVVKGDGEGYYSYLTAYLIDRDPSFRTLVQRRFTTPDALRLSGLSYQPQTDRYLVKYPPGEALMTLPFFAAGHAVALATGERADGYSRSEQLASGLAAIAWGLAGLAALRRLLLRWFSDLATAMTLVAIGLGTSLLHYLAYDSSYSHAFSFAAISMTMLTVIRWLERPGSWSRAIAAGLAAGLVIAVRPANIVAILPLALFGVFSRPTLMAQLRLLAHHWRHLLAAAAAASPAVIATLLAWRYAAGQLRLFTYGPTEQFSFLHPKWQVLYSFRPHGLLPYAPVLILALIGLVPLYRRTPQWTWSIALALALETYLLASWRAWPLGHAFGHRGYVDAVGLFALPLAALFAAVWRTRWKWPITATSAVAIATTMLGMAAHWQGRLPPDGAPPAGYLAAMVGQDRNP